MLSGNQPAAAAASTQPTRYMFILDLDENLISNLLSPDDRSSLSKSAEACIDHTRSITKINLFTHVSSEPDDNFNTFEGVIRVLSYDDWYNIFNRIININRRFGGELISVKFLTLARYVSTTFMEHVFIPVFGKETADQLFTQPYFFNFASMLESNTVDDKGAFMEYIYTQKMQAKMPDLTKKNIYLIDDNRMNCRSADMSGFAYIHNPTNPRRRGEDVSYSKEKAGVFQKINAILDEAEKYCEEITACKSPGVARK